jgi:catechol 2,3-dioxygenase-like lactoylglutathione lyase family enzyme
MRRTLVYRQAVPVLRVSDVARSVAWYRDVLGLVGDPFPAAPPHRFAILRRGGAEVMLRDGGDPSRAPRGPYDWDLYLRVEGVSLRELYAALRGADLAARRLERMAYGMSEFEVIDPDGHRICLAQELPDAGDLPTPEV